MSITCYIHSEKSSIGTCVGCGKFICEDCNTELKGKNYCKKCVDSLFDENNKKIEKLEDNKSNQPMVFMNAGGGGGGSSSSSSSSSSSGAGEVRRPVYTKSRVTAGVLAILLGGIGIHKFYLGKSGLGILYLVFCWTYIPAIIGLIEGIAYLLSNDESFAVKHDKGYRMV
ncbi:TM2 domain-containing membrane protein YozV [Bacillus luteolus]|nr:TM2 domain-containing membrane protein YozV [Cytobacillus luteolus]